MNKTKQNIVVEVLLAHGGRGVVDTVVFEVLLRV